MLYVICKAKNKIAGNEQIPKFNSENWEVVETVRCRKNASIETYNSIFSPIVQRLANDRPERIRLWFFKQEELIF